MTPWTNMGRLLVDNEVLRQRIAELEAELLQANNPQRIERHQRALAQVERLERERDEALRDYKILRDEWNDIERRAETAERRGAEREREEIVNMLRSYSFVRMPDPPPDMDAFLRALMLGIVDEVKRRAQGGEGE